MDMQPVDAKEDLYRLASPGAPGFESGAPVGEEQPPLRQQLSRLPFPGVSLILAPASCISGQCSCKID